MTAPTALIAPKAWVPDYVHGSLRQRNPSTGISCGCRPR